MAKILSEAQAIKRIRFYQKGTVEAFERFCLDCVHITGGDEESGTATIPFKWWPAQRELAEDLCSETEVIVLKTRQMGGTWVVIAWFLYRAMFWHGHEYRITSVGEDESSKALRRVKFMIDHLPDWCRPKLEISNTTTIKIAQTQSWITALPATINAGRGDTLNGLLSDEAAFQAYAKEIIKSARPALEKRHGSLIVVSTANGVGNHFQEEFVKAQQKQNGYRARFFGWQADPNRDQAWYDRMLKRHGSEYMHENYPATAAEAFLASGRPFFEQTRVVADLEKELPAFHDGFLNGKEFMPSSQGALRVWKKPQEGHSYVSWADTAEGLESGDWNNCYFLDALTLDICARVRGKMDSSEYGDMLMDVGRWYTDGSLPALLAIERNAGAATLKRILEAGYEHIYQDRNLTTGEVKADTYGWHTNVSTRQMMLGKAQALYRMGRAPVVDRDLLEEMALFAHRGPRGKPQSPPGKHDDCTMSWAGAVFIATYQSPVDATIPWIETDEAKALGFRRTDAEYWAVKDQRRMIERRSEDVQKIQEIGG